MKKLTAILLLLTLSPLPVFAQTVTYGQTAEETGALARQMLDEPPPTHKRRSPILALTGILLLGGGALIWADSFAQQDGDNYLYNGRAYCIDNDLQYGSSLDITRGECGDLAAMPEVRPYTYAAMGAGALLMFIGLQKVKISPQLAPGVVGVKARIRW
jgi:hypothetical protein